MAQDYVYVQRLRPGSNKPGVISVRKGSVTHQRALKGIQGWSIPGQVTPKEPVPATVQKKRTVQPAVNKTKEAIPVPPYDATKFLEPQRKFPSLEEAREAHLKKEAQLEQKGDSEKTPKPNKDQPKK